MKVYIVVKTVREDLVEDLPSYLGSKDPAVCNVNPRTGANTTVYEKEAKDAAEEQTREYGQYFNYTVHSLEV